MLLSSFLFSIMSLFVHFQGNNQFPSFEMVVIRSVMSVILVWTILGYLKISIFGTQNVRLFLLVRGTSGFVGLSCYYYALTQLALSDAVALSFLSPVLTAIGARIFLKEKLEIWDIFGSIISLTGICLITKPTFLFGGTIDDSVKQRLLGTGASLLGSVASMISVIMVRKVGLAVNALVFVNYFASVSTILGSAASAVFEKPKLPIGWLQWVAMIIIGLSGFGGQVCSNSAIQLVPAAKATSVTYISVVFAFAYQIFIFKEPLNWWSFSGSILISSYLIVILIKNWRTSE